MFGDWLGVPVIIVSYRTAGDVAACLDALDALDNVAAVSVHVCENGGSEAWEELRSALSDPHGPCEGEEEVPREFSRAFVRVAGLRLRRSGRPVFIGEAAENRGYAGGINTWLASLASLRGWRGCWILNPDTLAHPMALAALERAAFERRLGMVGSRLMAAGEDIVVQCRGLRWRSILASVLAVGRNDPAAVEPDPETIEARLHSPSGASCYVTRPCIEALYPLDERYFLFFEDLDWGMRARRNGYRVGHAHGSLVIDRGGTSAGGSRSSTSAGSELSIYLGFRNRLLFVGTHCRGWLLWTAFMGVLHALRISRRDRSAAGPAFRGLLAGLGGETGRPDWLVARHRLPDARRELDQLPAQAAASIEAERDARDQAARARSALDAEES